MESKWTKCISQSGTLRGVAIEGTELVQELARVHSLSGEPLRQLGEAALGAALLASSCKGEERVNLNIRGTGRVFQALVDAYPDGRIRGYVVERQAESGVLEEVESSHSHTGPWGEGLLSVLRSRGGENEQPYIGTVPLATGFLAKDLTFYWAQSEQVPSAVGIQVQMKGTEVEFARAFLIQVLPGATEQEVLELEKNVHNLQDLTRVYSAAGPLAYLGEVFQSVAFLLLEERPLRFSCTCSRERVMRALRLIGEAEITSILEEQGHAEVKCDFCSKQYRFFAEELDSIKK